MGRTIVFDTETTGFKAPEDEVLEITILEEENGVLRKEPLLHLFLKPENKTEWPGAMAVNHITPEQVKDCPTMSEKKAEIEKIFAESDTIISYNGRLYNDFTGRPGFDRPFLERCGVDTGKGRDVDVMSDIAEKLKLPGYLKLTYAAELFGYNPDYFNAAHDSREDAIATWYCHKCLEKFLEKEPSWKKDFYSSKYHVLFFEASRNKNGEYKMKPDGTMSYSFRGKMLKGISAEDLSQVIEKQNYFGLDIDPNTKFCVLDDTMHSILQYKLTDRAIPRQELLDFEVPWMVALHDFAVQTGRILGIDDRGEQDGALLG